VSMDDIKAAFAIDQEAYQRGFLAGARAMQEAAVKYHDDWIDGLTERLGAGHAYEIHLKAAAAIRAIDPEKVG